MCMYKQFVCVCVCVCVCMYIPVLVMFHVYTEINFLTSLAAGKTIYDCNKIYKMSLQMYTCITLLNSI